ncbi:MAG: FAD-dependent oxidoreductase [Lachnospiraceae bacterium]|nr:FAD-dependent oxidoreductase [Lachnospiraceae bacterium]
MIRLTQVKLPLEYTEEDLLRKCAGLLRVGPGQIRKWELIKRSVDARKKPDIVYSCTVDVTVEQEGAVLKRCRCSQAQVVRQKMYQFPEPGQEKLTAPIVIVGMGPAGLFGGYLLAKAGYRPVLLERGQAVELRTAAVEEFWKSGVLNPSSNVQFGEGGAGAFSDGKLNTTIRDEEGRIRKILEIFVENGAPKDILYEAKPHIGTDVLSQVVKNMRKRIISWGGQVRFESCVTDIFTKGDGVKGVEVNGTECLDCCALILAIGHSARDTFSLLHQKNIPMESKPFAVGFRVIHPQKLINQNQYGVEEHQLLGPASYKLTARASSGRGVYTFCMCPGGFVVNASSQSGYTAVNGMSYHHRAGHCANSAVVVTVGVSDFDGRDALAGVRFQQELEKRAYELGKGAVVAERYGEFYERVTGSQKNSEERFRIMDSDQETLLLEDCVKGCVADVDLTEILPQELNEAFVEGMEHFGSVLPGFSDSGTLLCGVESRTSSPVRILRKDNLESEAVSGLYPCGEGAGFAGGIVSAAADGMRAAETLAARYALPLT